MLNNVLKIMSSKKKEIPTYIKYVLDEEDVDDEIIQKKKQEHEGIYRYNHLSNEERTLADKLLRGCIGLEDVPKLRSNVVKMYISSTFMDMDIERNALKEHIYPQLREACRNEYGVDFYPVDMRWGYPIETGEDNSTVQAFLSELRYCQSSSLGPTIVAFIGQRYGWVPLPPAMYRAEYEVIEFHVRQQSKEDAEFMSKCYLKDQNVHPNVYRLQPISYITAKLKRSWCDIESDLRKIINNGGKSAMEATEISRSYFREIRSSVSEMELYQGLIGINKQNDRDNSAILFIRDFQDIHRNVQSTRAKNYIDIVGNPPEIDNEKKAIVDELKKITMGKLSQNNYSKASISWKESGIDQRFHQLYIKRVCNHFLSTASRLIKRNSYRNSQLNDDILYSEVLQHWNTARDRCQNFHGRQEELQTAKEYIMSDSNNQPLVIHGPSGGGKSSILAKTAVLAKTLDISVIVRFIGTTTGSSSIQVLISSICHQLAYCTQQKRSEIPEDFINLKIYFREMLVHGEFSGKVVIILDALNQLSTSLQGDKLDWLPARHSSKIRIIVSTTPTENMILDKLKHKIHDNFIQVNQLPYKICEEIFNKALEEANRKVSYEQWKLVTKAFQVCSLPLFVTLVIEEAKKWSSFDHMPTDFIKPTIDENIHELFSRMENKHGEVFVARAFGYLTLAKDGLSEAELEDILSLDDEVLNSIFLHWLPSMRRLPSYVWSRLHLDMKKYLVDRENDGTPVLSWYHQIFENVVRERYLSDDQVVSEMHRLIEQYYMGTWSGTKKTFKYTQELMQKLRIQNENGSAVRNIPKQPMVYEFQGTLRYNVRKLSQVPYSMLKSKQINRLKAKCLFNFEWIYCKLKGTSLQKLLTDYTLIQDKECNIVASALRMAGKALAIDHQVLVTELIGRLLPHCKKYSYIKQLVGQCDLAAQFYSSLIPNCQIYNTPGGPLQYERQAKAKPKTRVDIDVFSSVNGVLMTAKSYYSETVQVWEVSEGEPLQDLNLSIGNVYPSSDGKYLSTFKNNKFVMVYKSDGGELHGKIDYDYGIVNDVVASKTLLVFTTDNGTGPVIVDVKECLLLHTFNHRCSAFAIDPNETFLYFCSKNEFYLYALTDLERKCSVRMDEDVNIIQCKKNEQKCFAMSETNLLYSIKLDLLTMEAEINDIISDFDAKEFNLSHTENYILVRASRCLYLIDAQKEELLYRIQRMPDGPFVETMSTFSSAKFTSNDDMIVASRYIYIAFWNTNTGEPIRLIVASESPILKLFNCGTLNKIVSQLRNHTLQVWDIDNLDEDAQRANKLVRSRVNQMAISSHSRTLVCCSDKLPPEAIIADAGTCNIQKLVPYSKAKEDYISSIEMSPMGKYCVLKGKLSSSTTATIMSKILSDDLIYNMGTMNEFHKIYNNRFVVFDRTSSYIGCVQCLSYVPLDWIGNLYVLKLFQPRHYLDESRNLPIPENSEFVCKPLIYSTGKLHAFVAVYQSCEAVTDRITGLEKGRFYESRLSLLNLTTPNERSLTVKSLLHQANVNDKFIDVRLASSKKLVLFYAKNVEYFKFDLRCGLVCPPDVEKAFILYDPETDFMIRHVPSFLAPNVNISSCLFSKQGSVILSKDLQVFKNSTKGYVNTITYQLIPGSAKLALDGQYIVALCKSGKTVLVIKADDGEIAGRLFVHGYASCLDVAEDDRTVVVGCNDGRVLILTLILDSKDPVNDLIANLATRKTKSMADTLKLLDMDVVKANFRSDATGPKTVPKFKSVGKTITLANRAAKITKKGSQACSIQ